MIANETTIHQGPNDIDFIWPSTMSNNTASQHTKPPENTK